MNEHNIEKYIGSNLLLISETMQRIDSNSSGILFIVSKDDKLQGCITDGDIRRYLLSGGKMDDPVMMAVNHNPKVAYSEEEAQNIYHKRDFIVIPILDENNKISGVYLGNGSTVCNRPSLNVPVVINAGGKGTRLDPFTKVLPKPLIPIGEIPIIEHIMKEYQSYDCNDFHIIVNHKRELIKAYFSDSDNKYNINWYDEEKPLGTGGGLTLLRGKMKETFFFSNCDVILTANYARMMEFHKNQGNLITMICAHKNFMIPYGIVEIGNNGVIESMKEKPLMSFLTNTGIYIVEPEVIDDMLDDEAAGFPDIIERERVKGKKVAAYPVSENEWMDMGQLPELEKMRIKLYGE